MQLFRCDTSVESGFKVAILTRSNLSSSIGDIEHYYTEPLKELTNSDLSEVVIASIFNPSVTGTTYPVKLMDTALEKFYSFLEQTGIKFVYVIDKDISNRISMDKTKDMRNIFIESKGKCTPSVRFMCGVNFRTFPRTPSNEAVLKQSLNDIKLELDGVGAITGSKDLVNKLGLKIEYPKTILKIEDMFNGLLLEPIVASDIESYSLKTQEASVATISFSPNKKVGYSLTTNFVNDPKSRYAQLKPIMREFFEQYKGKFMFFNSTFDVKILTYELFMKNDLDVIGMRKGMDTFYERCEDPMLQAFILKNSSIKPELGLKVLLYKYFGNYGIDVKDIRTQSENDLLYYGALDSIGLHYIHEEFNGLMDSGDKNYYEFLKRTRKVVTEAEIMGMHMDMDKVNDLHRYLQTESIKEQNHLFSLPEVKKTENFLAAERYAKNFSNKRVIKGINDFKEPFNFNSSNQLAKLFFNVMDLPVPLTTEKGNPSTGKDSLNILKNLYENDENVNSIIDSVLNIKKYDIVLNTFIPAYSEYRWEKDNGGYLCGNLNIIGTQSGRFSSNNPAI